MPGRTSRISAPRALRGAASQAPSSRQSQTRKRKNRNLDAYAIAEKVAPARPLKRQFRLGEVENDRPPSKKQKVEEDDEEEEDTVPQSKRQPQRPVERGRDDLEDASGQDSDSDGNKWHTGPVGDDEDTEVDSDEAFGSSDEERFSGFTFRGGSSGSKAKRTKAQSSSRAKGLDLEEDEGSNDEEDDFGDEGVDLATMLDQDSESDGSDSEESVGKPASKPVRKHISKPASGSVMSEDLEVDESDSEADQSDASDEDEAYELSEDDEPQAQSFQQLGNLVKSMSRNEEAPGEEEASRSELYAQALATLQASGDLAPSLSREAQRLSRNLQQSSKNTKAAQLVTAPLPKRQQDRIDRAAARAETNNALDRWVDTVKHNRRADHLVFPLQNPNAQEPENSARLTRTLDGPPRNDLEATIASILRESGIDQAGGASVEKDLQRFEELATRKLPVEQVLARRAELRMQRELMFREEVKARRINKIKSKAYRRVHRKDAQKAAQKEMDMMAAAGIDMDEEEREAADRRRAEERMGGRHRESRWAKSVKNSGRAAWDAEARGGVADMARRDEELRRRVNGEADADDSDLSDGSVEVGDGGDDYERRLLAHQLDKVGEKGPEGTSTLQGLKFMQRAESALQQRNAEDIARLRRDLAGEESDSPEPPDTSLGRRVFGISQAPQAPAAAPSGGEFEEGYSSGDEQAQGQAEKQAQKQAREAAAAKPDPPAKRPAAAEPRRELGHQGAVKPFKAGRPTKDQDELSSESVESSESSAESSDSSEGEAEPADPDPDTTGWTTVSYPASTGKTEAEADDHDADQSTAIPSNFDLVQAAFGGDAVADAFDAEKRAAAESEDDVVVDGALPGWGSWAGEGVSKRELKRAAQRTKGRFLTTVEAGTNPQDRRDKKLSKVIISEKKARKSARYLASSLPHPYESRLQYERGLKQPIGPEWTTKTTFQEATKPRILAKPGRAIQPMEVPML